MDGTRVAGYRERVRDSLRLAFAEGHPLHVVAASFSLGVFVTTLPNLGGAIPLLGWIGYRFERANRLALLAALAVLNPLVKAAVYVASFVLGSALLGPVPGITRADVGLDAGPAVLTRLLLGNVVIAVLLAVVGYVVAYRAAGTYRRRTG
ncbi:DUF2062 domain-containing protein [Halobacteriales archaeon QS_1_68_20]|nr:MAG: DUF2062 domain-containing protein [Halobacteriales archaeon QS_1_68_20]